MVDRAAPGSGGGWYAGFRRVSSWVHALSGAFGILASVGLVVLVVASVADVLTREVTDSSLEGAVELSTLTLVAVAFLSLPYGEATRTHVRTGLVADRLPPRLSAGLEAVGGVVVSLLFLWITIESYDRAVLSLDTHESTPGLVNVAVWPARVIITLGCALLILELLINVVEKARIAVIGPTREEAR